MEEEEAEEKVERHVPIQTAAVVAVVERRKRVLSFRVNDPTPIPITRTPDLALRLGVVVHRPFTIWEWNGPTDRMQITVVLVPHRTSVESFTACIAAASNRFYLNPDKYCHSDVFDILYEDSIMTHTYDIADPRISNEVLVFYVPRVYFRTLKEQTQNLYDTITTLKTVCLRR